MRSDPPGQAPTTLSEPVSVFVLMWVGFPILGAAVGWGLAQLSGLVSGLAWFPFKGVFALVASIPQPQLTIGALVVGALLGMGVALLGHAETLSVTFSGDAITARRGDQTVAVETARVESAFRDGKYLVLLDARGAELLREKSDIDADRMRETFVAQGFNWLDADPHHGQWRVWVDGTPDLPDGGNALLRTREKELKKSTPDLVDVRAELLRLGIMVRDDKRKQYWRQVKP